MLTELMGRIHQKNPLDLELREPNHKEWYLVPVTCENGETIVQISFHPTYTEALIQITRSHTKY